MTAVQDMLDHIPLLSECRLNDRVEFDRLVERRTFQRGENILVEGKVDPALWLLLEGRCEVVKCGNGHGERRLAVIEPGGVFGEMSFLKAAPHSATVRALSDVVVARLTPAAFEELRETSPAAAYCIVMNLVTLLSERLRRMDDRICELLAHSSDERQKEWQDFRARLFAGDFN